MARRKVTSRRDTEPRYFPEYDGYRSLVCADSIYAVWYIVTHREHGERRKPTYREDADSTCDNAYAIRKDSVLTRKAIGVGRGNLPVANSTYYISHIPPIYF